MSIRGVHISEPARLYLKHFCLNIKSGDKEPFSVALEDINYIVLDTDQVNLSAALLSACAEKGCLVICCDKKHMPNGSLLPFHTFYRQLETVQAQLKLSLPRKKRLWQQIIQHKIRNQATCLALFANKRELSRKVAVLEKKVTSGDPDNVEALAARLYFKGYMQGFQRDSKGEDRLNALLNYGYALIRAAIARNLTVLGFITCLGVQHRGMENAFNLADDLIEPWRPFVDAHARVIFEKRIEEKKLNKEDRQELTNIFNYSVLFEQGESFLVQALRRQAEQLRSFYQGGTMPNFPDFAPGGQRICQAEE